MASAVHFLNGKFVEEKDLVVSVRDLGYTRGYTVFDYLRTYPHHRPFKLKEHIDRLFNSADLVGLKIPWIREEINKWTLETLDKNNDPSEKTIKIIISGGVSDELVPAEKPTLVIIIDSRPTFSDEVYEKGIGMITVKHTRYNPGAKSANYIESVKQTQIAQKTGAVEPIYYDDNQIFEGAISSIFAVIDGVLMTPKSNILSGITRQTVLNILDFKVDVRNFKLEDLMRATEVFSTSSNREIAPVTKIDGEDVGDGKVGPITKKVMKQFNDYTASDKW